MASLYKSVNLKLNLRISVGQQTFLFRWSVEFLAVSPHCNAALPSFIHVKRFSSQRRKAWIRTNRKYDFRASVREQSRDTSRDSIIIHLWRLEYSKKMLRKLRSSKSFFFLEGGGKLICEQGIFIRNWFVDGQKSPILRQKKNNGKSTRNSGTNVFNWMFCYEYTRVLFCCSMVFNRILSTSFEPYLHYFLLHFANLLQYPISFIIIIFVDVVRSYCTLWKWHFWTFLVINYKKNENGTFASKPRVRMTFFRLYFAIMSCEPEFGLCPPLSSHDKIIHHCKKKMRFIFKHVADFFLRIPRF